MKQRLWKLHLPTAQLCCPLAWSIYTLIIHHLFTGREWCSGAYRAVSLPFVINQLRKALYYMSHFVMSLYHVCVVSSFLATPHLFGQVVLSASQLYMSSLCILSFGFMSFLLELIALVITGRYFYHSFPQQRGCPAFSCRLHQALVLPSWTEFTRWACLYGGLSSSLLLHICC